MDSDSSGAGGHSAPQRRSLPGQRRLLPGRVAMAMDGLRRWPAHRRRAAVACSIVAAAAAVALVLLRPDSPIAPSPAATAAALCGLADLDPQPYVGTSEGPVVSFAIRVTGARACRFIYHPVFIGQRDFDGAVMTVQPLRARTLQEVVVAPRHYVTFSMITETTGTPCPAMFTYGNVEMVFNGGNRYKMPGVTFTWNCSMYLQAWSTDSSPGSSLRQAA